MTNSTIIPDDQNMVAKSVLHVLILVFGVVSFILPSDFGKPLGFEAAHVIWTGLLLVGSLMVIASHMRKNKELKRAGLSFELFAFIGLAAAAVATGTPESLLTGLFAAIMAWIAGEKIWMLMFGDRYERWAVLGWAPRHSCLDSAGEHEGTNRG